MNEKTQYQLAALKRELADTELSIEQSADQGDTITVEYYDNKRTTLAKEIKRINDEDEYLQRVNSEDNGTHVSIKDGKYNCH